MIDRDTLATRIAAARSWDIVLHEDEREAGDQAVVDEACDLAAKAGFMTGMVVETGALYVFRPAGPPTTEPTVIVGQGRFAREADAEGAGTVLFLATCVVMAVALALLAFWPR